MEAMSKYVEVCVDLLQAIELKTVELYDGNFIINDRVILYCPWCGKKLPEYINVWIRNDEADD